MYVYVYAEFDLQWGIFHSLEAQVASLGLTVRDIKITTPKNR